MIELFRIEHLNKSNYLREYFLSIHEKEIVYVFSHSHKTLYALRDLMCEYSESCQKNQMEKEKYNKSIIKACTVYKPLFGAEFITEFSVADNLARDIPFYKIYSKKELEQSAKMKLEELGFDINVATKFYELTRKQKIELSLIKGIVLGEDLMIIDMVSNLFDEEGMNILTDTITKLHSQNMSFIILSSKVSRLVDIADKIQFVSKGTVIREFRDGLPEGIIASNADNIMIPEDVDEYFFDNMDIKDNLIIELKNKCSKGLLMPINKKMVRKITEDFYKKNNISKRKKYLNELTDEEKIKLYIEKNKMNRKQ